MKLRKITAFPGETQRAADPSVAAITGIKITRKATTDFAQAAFRCAAQTMLACEAKEKIAAIIVVTQTPPYFCPSFACKIRAHLNLPETAICFDLNQGCAGFVMGLQVVNALVPEGKLALLICGDHLSELISKESLESVFSDCVTATLVEVTNRDHQFITRHPNGNTDAVVCHRPGFLNMNGHEVHYFSQKEVPAFVKEDVAAADIVFFHQANAAILSGLRTKLGISELRAPSILENMGNASSASIPLAMCVFGLAAGERALLVGFGSGLTMSKTVIHQDIDLKTEIIEDKK